MIFSQCLLVKANNLDNGSVLTTNMDIDHFEYQIDSSLSVISIIQYNKMLPENPIFPTAVDFGYDGYKIIVNQSAFYDKDISGKLTLPSDYQRIDDVSFANNQITEIDMPGVISVGKSSFSSNPITTINSPNLSFIDNDAFWSTDLESLTLNQIPQMPTSGSTTPFEGNYGANVNFGYFPIYVSTEGNDIVIEINQVVINPTKQFIDEKLAALSVDEHYLYNIKRDSLYYDFATANDHQGNYFYCISYETYYVNGIYTKEEVKETIYIIQQGSNNVDPKKEHLLALDQEPENYVYGFSTDLLSKLIWHASHFAQGNNQGKAALIYAIVSNERLSDTILTVENVKENIQATPFYENAVSIMGQTVVDRLLDSVKNDTREYSPAQILGYKTGERPRMEFAQPLLMPGLPIDVTTDITVTKEWIESPNVKPDIAIQLYRNNQAFGEVIVLDGSENWTYTWGNMLATDAYGVPYQYTVDEVTVPDGYIKVVGGMTIRNVFDPIGRQPGGEKPEEDNSKGDSDNFTIPKTSSSTVFMPYAVTVVLSVGTVLYLRKKEE